METPSTVAPDLRAHVEAMFRSYAARDFRTFAGFLDDNVEWTISGPVDILPFCGTRRGKCEVIKLIVKQIPVVLRIFNFAPEALLVDGDNVAALNRVRARHSSDGRLISYRIANFMRFRDRLCISNLSLLDSFDAAEQVLGHSLATGEATCAREGDLIAI
jgi:ketosteroid isomerase-like protein